MQPLSVSPLIHAGFLAFLKPGETTLDDNQFLSRISSYQIILEEDQTLAADGTVVMVFEDLHWADDGLLDFIEHLLEPGLGAERRAR